mgnify:CR=1 FL=1
MPRNFTVIECEQRSSEWFATRAGVLGASSAGDMLARIKTGEASGRRDLRTRLVVERLTGQPVEDGYINADMQRGIDLEPEARAAYEAETSELVQQVGYLKHDTLPIGCSPDGIVGDFEGGVEIKCPRSANHLRYLREKCLPLEYVAQITHSLFVTGAPWWDFVSYDPRFPEPLRVFIVRVRREEVDLAAYEVALSLFLTEVDKETAEVVALAAERTAA